MPNHITNIVRFDCSKDKFLEIARFVQGKTEFLGGVDFNTLIPMPESLNVESSSRGFNAYTDYCQFLKECSTVQDKVLLLKIEEKYKEKYKDNLSIWELGKQYYTNKVLYGQCTWYEWSYSNWNTKWNAYECLPVGEDDQLLMFLSAWSNVSPVIIELSRRFPTVRVDYDYADEAFGSNCGRVSFLNGEVIDEFEPEDLSKEAYELAASIMDMDLEEMGYVLSEDGSTYDYKEDY